MKTNTFPKMHVSLYVSDIAKTKEFYTKFFGQEADKTKNDYCKFILDSPALIISFVQNKERVKENFGHLGFQVETKEELKSRMSTAEELNMVSLVEEGTACCYAEQDKFWVSDPDGIQWEVYYFHKDVAFNDPKYASQDSTACCAEPVELQKEEAKCAPNSGCC
ncbi:MAG: glyoxalase/bleomycin resistance/dioxygenase family protein [Bacteroidia bacterium]|nr:VOC family protein [Bacteroidia bacterium]NNC85968.1 glyoxalase/bleomycin resistance/dioxygenase family protein [Bacteroidia bacterium]NNM15387.1 glyoxalase/bleomycin resistance/dioxygenase family protein [Bacteroidia bacterium]